MSLHPCQQQTAATAPSFCEVCKSITPTRLIPLSGGIGNCCAVCRACRKGRPYVSKQVYAEHIANTQQMGKGRHHANTNRSV